jgi:hypothetical protein
MPEQNMAKLTVCRAHHSRKTSNLSNRTLVPSPSFGLHLVHNRCILQQEAIGVALHICISQSCLGELARLLTQLLGQVVMGECPLQTALQV